jgi:hypothetical protein
MIGAFFGLSLDAERILGFVVARKSAAFQLVVEDQGPLILTRDREHGIGAGFQLLALDLDVMTESNPGAGVSPGTPALAIRDQLSPYLAFFAGFRIIH